MDTVYKLALLYAQKAWVRRRWAALVTTTFCVLGWIGIGFIPDRYESLYHFHK